MISLASFALCLITVCACCLDLTRSLSPWSPSRKKWPSESRHPKFQTYPSLIPFLKSRSAQRIATNRCKCAFAHSIPSTQFEVILSKKRSPMNVDHIASPPHTQINQSSSKILATIFFHFFLFLIFGQNSVNQMLHLFLQGWSLQMSRNRKREIGVFVECSVSFEYAVFLFGGPSKCWSITRYAKMIQFKGNRCICWIYPISPFSVFATYPKSAKISSQYSAKR